MARGVERRITGMFLVGVVLGLVCVAGWVMNVIDVVGIDNFGDMSGSEILSIAGIFVPPLGAVLGWL